MYLWSQAMEGLLLGYIIFLHKSHYSKNPQVNNHLILSHWSWLDEIQVHKNGLNGIHGNFKMLVLLEWA